MRRSIACAFAAAALMTVTASTVTALRAGQRGVASCDSSLWKHVYNPARLKLIKSCVTVTGTVVISAPDDDGDQHFLLHLDPGQESLLRRRNITKKNDALVVEIVCANPAKRKKARKACAGYTNRIAVPAARQRVRVTGSYVIDTHNDWAEIHPVSRLETLK